MRNAIPIASMPEKRSRVLYFRIIVALLPLLVLLLLEASLRLADYGGNLALFVPTSRDFADQPYWVINPRVAERYFPKGYYVPEPTSDGFLQEKPARSYRVFVLGESTTAGWPYPNNVMFTRRLQRQLEAALPDKQIEVVNLGIAAINSYTLLDFIDEVLEQRPDALLIYAGHNEFYGAFGAASTVSLGQSTSLVRLYLWLQRSRLFLLLRDAVNRATTWVRPAHPQPGHGSRPPTLMGQVIGQEHIPLDSEIYARGKNQFRENLSALLRTIKSAGIPLIVSELVSNVRDQPPFFANRGGAPSPADQAFRSARDLETHGQFEAALAEYYKAKDLDGLRFRAPEEFNAIIHELAGNLGIPVVPMKSYFEAASPHGLIGENLMLEHLHPTARGYQLMGQAFFDAMHKHRLLGDTKDIKAVSTGDFERFTELDVAIGKMRILQLTDHWPFKAETESNNAVHRYVPETKAEELAKDFFLKKLGFAEAHVRMAEYYASRGRQDASLREFWALINSAPQDVENYLGTAQVLINAGLPQHAWPFVEASLKIRSTDADTERLVADLAAELLRNNDMTETRRVFARWQAAAPGHPGIKKLAEQLR